MLPPGGLVRVQCLPPLWVSSSNGRAALSKSEGSWFESKGACHKGIRVKRSEAVKVIERVIDDNTYDIEIAENRIERIAEQLMEAIEKDIKMIPPTVYLKLLKTYDNGWDDE